MPKTIDSTCREATDQLHAYLDDALSPGARQGMETHVRRCDACRDALGELRCVRRLLRSMPRDEMPSPMKQDLLEHLRYLRELPSDR